MSLEDKVMNQTKEAIKLKKDVYYFCIYMGLQELIYDKEDKQMIEYIFDNITVDIKHDFKKIEEYLLYINSKYNFWIMTHKNGNLTIEIEGKEVFDFYRYVASMKIENHYFNTYIKIFWSDL